MARQGKIARLPHDLREAVNRRLLDGEPGSSILDWLNAKPEAAEVWAEWFDAAPATAQNLSEWRLGGYRDWLRQRERVESIKSLSTWALSIAKAGGNNLSDAAASIAAGRILQNIESAEDEELANMMDNLAALRRGDTARAKVNLDTKRLEIKERELALAEEKFQTQTVDKFITFAKTDDARKILESGKPQHVQTSLLRELMFGKAKGGKE